MKKVLTLLLLIPVFGFSQVEAKYFNAAWNSSNDINWFMGYKTVILKV